MLWDMVRYENFDETSPYNREAAAWAKGQTFFRLPIDSRPLRDKLARSKRLDEYLSPLPAPHIAPQPSKLAAPWTSHGGSPFRQPAASRPPADTGVCFLGEVEVVEAQVVAQPADDADILFIE
jgi:hypothetical protein